MNFELGGELAQVYLEVFLLLKDGARQHYLLSECEVISLTFAGFGDAVVGAFLIDGGLLSLARLAQSASVDCCHFTILKYGKKGRVGIGVR